MAPCSTEDKTAHETQVNVLFVQGIFPDLADVRSGEVVRGCLDHRYQTGKYVLEALEAEVEGLGVKMAEYCEQFVLARLGRSCRQLEQLPRLRLLAVSP